MPSRLARTMLALLGCLAVGAHAPAAGQVSGRQVSEDVGEDCTLALPRPASAPHVAAHGAGPHGRALGALDAASCALALREAVVPFEPLTAVEGVAEPVRLRGAIEGVTIRTQGHAPRDPRAPDHRLDAVLDCRLALALRTFATWTREAGYDAIEHVSVFRPHARVAGTGRTSGHAHALAIDVLAFVRADGTRFTILDDWIARERGGEPCATHEEPSEQARVRALVCRGVNEGLFQVVITPHNDDRHANHVHLEIRPDVDWAIIR